MRNFFFFGKFVGRELRESSVAAVYFLRLRAVALALRGPPAIRERDIGGGHRSCEKIEETQL